MSFVSLKKPQRLYSVTETAEILNVSERTVRRMIENGRLRHVPVGRLIRIAPVDLYDFIRDHRCP
jgi:excisionase family DNA binding protein